VIDITCANDRHVVNRIFSIGSTGYDFLNNQCLNTDIVHVGLQNSVEDTALTDVRRVVQANNRGHVSIEALTIAIRMLTANFSLKTGSK
jgi:hypothetical protein